jgi:WXG100 family type VII secretion target
MSMYQTGHAELMSAAQEMEDGNVDLMEQLKQFISAVDAIEGAWKGAAHTAFQQLSQKFAADSKALNDNLLAISEAVTGSAQAYQQQEQAATESVSAISATLEG